MVAAAGSAGEYDDAPAINLDHLLSIGKISKAAVASVREIVAFLDSMVPPCDRFYKEERDAECEGGSGEPWGGANATEQDAGELLLEAVNASASGGDAEGGAATLGETNMQHDD